MHIIHLDRIAVHHAGRPIFWDLSWTIGDHDRIGLVGPNAAGKSSLLAAISGSLPVDRGTVTCQRGVTVGCLSQEIDFEGGRSLIEEASVAPPELARVEAELERIELRLADPGVCGNEKRLARALEQQQRALERYEELGGPRHHGRVRELLAQLGLAPADYDLPAATLSGGQKKLVALVRLALESPDVLLLDEPDNHLDLDAKRRLEAFIHDYDGAVVIVSHDRYLLDETVTQIAQLESGRLTLYRGNYGAYARERELRRLQQKKRYADQQKEIARIEAAIKRFELWASMVVNERHAKQASSRRKMLERMEARGELVEKVTEHRRMGLQLEGWRGSKNALEIADLAMGFKGELLFSGLELLVRHRERVGLIGPNGTGKSVLFQIILRELQPLRGGIRIGPSTRIGYYAQEHQTLEGWLDRTPVERVRGAAPMTEDAAVRFLLRFLFRYDQVRQPIRTMSGGERSRLQLGCLMLERPNLLLLDEPTNNLDIPSAEVLEEALEDFEGAILVISHDRYLLDGMVDRVVELREGALRSHTGGYTDFLEACGEA